MINDHINKYNVIKNAIILALFIIFFIFPMAAQAETGVILRPHAGYGYISSSDSEYEGAVYHAGGRLLLGAGENKKYGLEATYFELDDKTDFFSCGIVLEQKLWGWFNMSIGTVGYFNYGPDSDNTIGLTTNLGWEPDSFKKLTPFITYRNDMILHDNTAIVNSLSVGLAWHF